MATKTSFAILEESDYYGIVHFDCGMKSKKINAINEANGLGLKFYAS